MLTEIFGWKPVDGDLIHLVWAALSEWQLSLGVWGMAGVGT